MNKKIKKLNAFTLAEVLITLGVIGVVAAVTMPTLIKNYQKKQTVVQLKKAYSELSQAISAAQKDFGMFEDWNFANFPTATDRNLYFYENFLKPNLKIVKYCAPSSGDCWADDSYTLTGTKYTTLNNSVQGNDSFVTASGYSVFFWLHGSGTGGWFFVDLNGKKKPNVLGKDIFTFMLNNSKRPYKMKYGISTNGSYYIDNELNRYVTLSREEMRLGSFSGAAGCCAKDCAVNKGQGLHCAALIMFDGWEIKDDYPW